MRKARALVALLAIGACHKAADQPAGLGEMVADATAAPVAFNQCKMCHVAAKGTAATIGPNLWGVYGQHAGAVPGYAFSPAFKGWNATLDDATLDAYLTDPQGVVPGTKMAFGGIKDPAARHEVIAYLKTLR